MNMFDLLAECSLIFIICICFLRSVKAIRGQRGALTQRINFEDIKLILIFSVGVTFLSQFEQLNTLINVFIAAYGILLWLDAILFVQYRIEINRQTIAWFFTGSKGLKKGVPHLLSIFKVYPIALLVPAIWVVSVTTFTFTDELILLGQVALVNIASLFLCVYWLKIPTLWLLLVSAAVAGFTYNLNFIFPESFKLILSLGFVIAMLTSFALVLQKRLFVSHHEFLTSPTLLMNIFFTDQFVTDDNVKIRREHKGFIAPERKPQEKSDVFGTCQGANIILVTMESLGNYIQPYTSIGARSLLAKRFANNSWSSQKHFCLCPNTTVSTNQMYTGDYSNNPYNKHDSLFPGSDPKYISALKSQGYKTLFLDSANTDLYDYHKLLHRIGFDKFWGTDDIPSDGLTGDYRLWNMVDKVVEEIDGEPFFLHIINDQTHMPYEIIDKERFNRHTGQSQKSIYLNAIEEVDHILDEFLNRLGERIDLSNTILVFTGDHGESFGEYGYSFHSNSVVWPQIQVPFMLHHPKLSQKSIEHSCHFDLFPTFFDLLGLEYSHSTIGKSLGFNNRDFAYFVHSATLKGDGPANFGFIDEDGLRWVDRLFNRVSILDSENCVQETAKQEKEYTKQLLRKMLVERGILL